MADELASDLEAQEGIVAPPEGEGDPPAPKTIEDYARDRGWRPKEEWSGDGEWRDAESFLSFGLDRARDLNRDVREMRATMEHLRQSQEQSSERAAAAARDAEKKRWEGLLSVAVQEGDEGKAFEATQKIADLNAQPIRTPQNDPLVPQFIAENSWFNTDPDAKALAVAAAQRVADAGGAVAEQLKAAKEAVHKRFPEYAPQPAKVVEVAPPASRLPANSNRQKGFADLTSEQQLAAKFLVQQGRIKSVEDYVRQAFNTEGTIE